MRAIRFVIVIMSKNVSLKCVKTRCEFKCEMDVAIRVGDYGWSGGRNSRINV
jgi:hypothetical protein